MTGWNRLLGGSSLEREFFRYLEDADVKVISFDIFDTLALRDVQRPEQIFLRVGEKPEVLDIFDSPLSFKNFRVEAERRAREKYPQYEDIKLEWIYDLLPIPQKLKKRILEYEIEEERKSIFINKSLRIYFVKWSYAIQNIWVFNHINAFINS